LKNYINVKTNMTKPAIQNLFPIPIYMSNINREFTKKELDYVKQQQKNCAHNNLITETRSNISTRNNYVLNNPEFKKIKKFIDTSCQDYLDKIICPKQNLKLCVTQSWLNYTEENQNHHRHEHPNSIISGVFYFNSDKKNDNIKFYNPITYRQILPEIDNTKYNIWNSDSWWLPVETGELIMFPSSTSHEVDIKKGTNTRVSLAFNTFYKGVLGSNYNLTELVI
tara:strand:+ start:2204 stop:2875 length:672 start_codon:yes stop_codon:yes gene_type:complete